MPTANTGASVSAIARAAALRNSQYALTSSINGKRKRNAVLDAEDGDDSDSPDAQLARALQEQEDAAAATMRSDSGSALRRTSARKARRIFPKSDYISDSEGDSDFNLTPCSAPSSSPMLNIELGSKGANAVSFSSKGKSNEVLDSDDSDRFIEIDDSDDEEPIISKSTPRTRMKQVIEKQSSDFKSNTSLLGRSKMPPPRRPAMQANKVMKSKPALKREGTSDSSALSSVIDLTDSEFDSDDIILYPSLSDSDDSSDGDVAIGSRAAAPRIPRSSRAIRQSLNLTEARATGRAQMERARLERHHPELHTMWKDLENLPKIEKVKIEQPTTINRELKPFQLEGVAWMKAMEEDRVGWWFVR